MYTPWPRSQEHPFRWWRTWDFGFEPGPRSCPPRLACAGYVECWYFQFQGLFIEDLPLLHNYLSSSGTGPSKPARYLLASILTVSPESLKVDWIWDFKSISTSENSSAFRTDLEALWYDNAEWWWESIYKSCQHTFQVWLILSIIQNFKLVTKFFVIVISLTRIKH